MNERGETHNSFICSDDVALEQAGVRAVFISGCEDVSELLQELSQLTSLVHLQPLAPLLGQIHNSLSGFSCRRWWSLGAGFLAARQHLNVADEESGSGGWDVGAPLEQAVLMWQSLEPAVVWKSRSSDDGGWGAKAWPVGTMKHRGSTLAERQWLVRCFAGPWILFFPNKQEHHRLHAGGDGCPRHINMDSPVGQQANDA